MVRKFAFMLCLCVVSGALLLASPRPALADSVITNCSNDSQLTTALASGGNIMFNCGTAAITLNSYYFIGVDTTIDGGGKITLSGGNNTRLFWVNTHKSLTLRNITITNGYSGAAYGGCIYVNGGTLVVQNSTLQKCSTNNYAGGAIVSPNGSVVLDHVVMKDNSASSGGAVSATGTVVIDSSQFLNNTVANAGGAVSVAANVLISNSTFTGNKATGGNGQGGAIYSNGTTTIHASRFGANQALQGGAIYVEATSTLAVDTGSLLSENSATNGGGLYARGSFTFTNVTLSGNSATNNGGGIMLDGTGTGGVHATIINVTFSDNSAPNYGGIAHGSNGSFGWTIRNSLFAKGSAGGNCGNFKDLSGWFNLSDDLSCEFGDGRYGVPLNLGPLAYNGNSIQTRLPKPGSPAIDNGTGTGAPATDARGNSRPQGLAVDVGAVEVCAVKPDKPVLVSPTNTGKYKGTQVALNWDDTPCADRYKITVQDAATGTKVQGSKSGTSDFRTTTLVKGKSYLWFVQACNTIGCTKSDAYKFTVK